MYPIITDTSILKRKTLTQSPGSPALDSSAAFNVNQNTLAVNFFTVGVFIGVCYEKGFNRGQGLTTQGRVEVGLSWELIHQGGVRGRGEV